MATSQSLLITQPNHPRGFGPFPQKENDAKNKAKHLGQLEWL